MLQANIRGCNSDHAVFDWLEEHASNDVLSTKESSKNELRPAELVHDNPSMIKRSLLSQQVEQGVFASMRASAVSALLIMTEDESFLDMLKSMLLDIEDTISKFHVRENNDNSAAALDIFGAIDALETVIHVSGHNKAGDKQIATRQQRLKRRLTEWSAPPYLIINALKSLLEGSDLKETIDSPAILSRLNATVQSFLKHRNRMVQANIRLVYSVANRFRYLGLAFEDLVQEGHLGLIKAIERFDVSKGFRFSTYAHIVISQSIHLALDKQVALVRLPFKALREKATVDKTRQQLEQRLGRSPHIYELSAALPDDLEYKAAHIASLVEPNASALQLYQESQDAEQQASCSMQEQGRKTARLTHADFLEQMLTRLNPRESTILRMRYGIGLAKEFTLEEISQSMSLSRERVRQLSIQGIERLGLLYANQ